MPYTIVYYLDSHSFGGAEQVLYTVLGELDRNHWRPIVTYHQSDGISPFIDKIKSELGFETEAVPKIHGYNDIGGAIRLAKRIRAFSPDIFHANLNWMLSCTGGIVSAFLAGASIIVGTQHLYSDLGSRSKRLEQKLISYMVDKYIAVSHDVAREMEKTIHSKRKITVIHNGIDIGEYGKRGINAEREDPFASLRKRNPGAAIILTVARLDKQKGHIYLLNAARDVSGAVFVFAGDGPERTSLEDAARELGVTEKVVFLGSRKDVPELLKASDIFVLPSLFEGLPLSIMEAMAARKPVIASDIGGVRELLKNGETGILTPPGDIPALSTAITTLLINRELADKMAASGESLVNRDFSSARMTKDLTNLYRHLLSE